MGRGRRDLEYEILYEFRERHYGEFFSEYCRDEEYLRLLDRDDGFIRQLEAIVHGDKLYGWYFGIYLFRDRTGFAEKCRQWKDGIIDVFWLHSRLVASQTDTVRRNERAADVYQLSDALLTDGNRLDRYPILFQIDNLYYSLDMEKTEEDDGRARMAVDKYGKRLYRMLHDFWLSLRKRPVEYSRDEIETTFVNPYMIKTDIFERLD